MKGEVPVTVTSPPINVLLLHQLFILPTHRVQGCGERVKKTDTSLAGILSRLFHRNAPLISVRFHSESKMRHTND